MADQARVIKIEPGMAWVELEWNEACTSCRSREVCFSGSDRKKNAIQAHDKIGVAVGDRVEIEFPGGWRIASAAWIFGLPVIFMLAGYFVGVRLMPTFSPDTAGLLGTLIFLGLSLLVVRLFDRKGRLVRSRPGIIRISSVHDPA